ncbi:MAG: hypothetical protein H6563_12555 [Lewinellaceae bacterium]|nr:hypothetical protein [Lewinellaceae bacterium]
MRKFLSFIAIACLPILAVAQVSQDYAGCPDAVVQDPMVTPLFGKSSDDLQDYFSEKLQTIIDNQHPTGEFELKLVIDENGAPCLTTFTQTGDVRIEPNHIKNIVDNMEGWQPALQDARPVSSQVMLLIRFKSTKVTTRILTK